jgi:hypothetical protein
MKKYFFIAILFPILSNAQSILESKILQELNNYRNSFGLTSMHYDSLTSIASKHHSEWMNLTGVVSHFEISEMRHFHEILSLEDRNSHYGLQMISEICTSVPSEGFLGHLTDDFIAASVIESFASSPKHNDVMKMQVKKDFPVGVGIGAIKGKDGAWVTINFAILQEF